jgi:hypothetical protein
MYSWRSLTSSSECIDRCSLVPFALVPRVMAPIPARRRTAGGGLHSVATSICSLTLCCWRDTSHSGHTHTSIKPPGQCGILFPSDSPCPAPRCASTSSFAASPLQSKECRYLHFLTAERDLIFTQIYLLSCLPARHAQLRPIPLPRFQCRCLPQSWQRAWWRQIQRRQ